MKKKSLRYEISMILIVKVILLSLVWYICFSEPIDNHDVKIMSQRVSSHLLNTR